jgi:FolB domain-containing protein
MIIRIKRLHTSSLIGILPDEYKHRQPLIIDLELHFTYLYDQQVSGTLPELDYSRVEQEVKDLVEDKHHGLLEDLAHLILDELFLRYPIITQAKVVLSKPQALKHSETVEVELVLDR